MRFNGFRLTLPATPHQALAAREVSVADFLPFSHLMDPATFVTHDGALGRVLCVRGLPFETCDKAACDRYHHQLAALWCALPDTLAVYITQHHHPVSANLSGNFPAGLARDFDAAYRQRFAEQTLFVQDYYVTLVTPGIKAPMPGFRRFRSPAPSAYARALKKQQVILSQGIQTALTGLAPYGPALLGEETAGGRSSLLGFLSVLVNGRGQPLAYPAMDLSAYLPARRLSFGPQRLMWQGSDPADVTYGAMLAVKAYQRLPDNAALQPLLAADFEWLSTHVWLRQPKTPVLHRMAIQLHHLEDADDAALTQRDELAGARDGLASGFTAFGEHHHSLLVMAPTPDALNTHLAQLTAWYWQAGLVMVRESLGLESCFFAQLPGNFRHIRRGALVSSHNVADYAPLYTYHTGYRDANHLGSAVMLVESQGRTPLYLNFHEQGFGTPDNPPLGHTLMIAPSGTGKTLLLCALDCQAKKYGGTSCFFDRDRGCEIYIRAMGGFYTAITPGVATGFNPLQLPDTPANRDFLVYWFASLLAGNAALPESARHGVEEVIHRNYTLPRASRRLSVVADFLPVDFAYREALTPWLRSRDPSRADGSLAYLFDNPVDTLDFENQALAGFDMTYLLSDAHRARAFSVFLYLFHRMEQRMDGRLFGLYLDEAWQFLNHPYWIQKMEAFLLARRKANAYLVFISQSIDNMVQSPLKSHLLENTATQIFLANDKADREACITHFHLTEGEYQFIRETGKASRRFLFKQGKVSAIGRLNLTGLEDFMHVFSGNAASIQRCAAIRAEVGEDPSLWLPVFLRAMREEK